MIARATPVPPARLRSLLHYLYLSPAAGAADVVGGETGAELDRLSAHAPEGLPSARFQPIDEFARG